METQTVESTHSYREADKWKEDGAVRIRGDAYWLAKEIAVKKKMSLVQLISALVHDEAERMKRSGKVQSK